MNSELEWYEELNCEFTCELRKDLVGKKILGLQINNNKTILVFNTDQGIIRYKAVGDCCSESWFADITGVSALIGGTVRVIERISMNGYNTKDGRGRQEYDQAYGYKFKTDKGYADIVFRNSSNGYYGGWIEPLNEEIPIEFSYMTEIVDDWNA